jgi:hypothetical protein
MFFKNQKSQKLAVNPDDEFNALKYALYQMCGMDDTVYNYYDKRSQCLPRSLSAILLNIRDFDNSRGHFERISGRIRGIDESVFEACVKDLLESGLLITKSQALAKLRSGEAAESTKGISIAAWITKDRQDSLAESMESFAANFRAHGRTVDFFVSDDSLDESGSGSLGYRLESIAKKEGIRITHMSRGARKKLRDDILDKASLEGLPSHVLDFALFGAAAPYPSYGANRNAVLLANAGEMILCSDDDVYCDLRVPAGDGYDLEIVPYNRLDIRETYPDRETLVISRLPADGDILAFHERLLGRPVSRIMSDISDDKKIKISALIPELLTLLLRRGGQVKTTITGVTGDSGLITPRYQVVLKDEAREKHVESELTFRKLLRSREIYQTSYHYTLAPDSLFWGMNLGIDVRTIAPPFLPSLRGEDIIFCKLLRTVSENSLIGSLPVAIYHNPVERRQYPENCLMNVRPEACHIFSHVMDTCGYPSGISAPSGRFNDMGIHLSGIASLPLEEFDEYIRHLWLTNGMIITASIENLLMEYDYKPSYWADYLEKYILGIRNYGYEQYISAAQDFYSGDRRAAALSCRDIMMQFGELLTWWPVIFNAALDIRQNR